MATAHRQRQLPSPASLDSSGHAELRAELLRRLPPGGGATQLPPRQEAADATGAVQVAVDARGRVLDVEISRRWRDRLGRDGLPAAVFEAYTAARQQAIEAFMLATAAAEEAGVAPPRLPPTTPARRPRPKPPTGLAEFSVWLHEEFARIREDLELMAGTSARAAPCDHTGPHGHLTATLQGEEVIGIAGDARQIWYADTGHLREDAVDVLSADHRPDSG